MPNVLALILYDLKIYSTLLFSITVNIAQFEQKILDIYFSIYTMMFLN